MCADTVTVNFGWVKPEVAGSATTWGAKQNSVFDLIDAQVYANQQSALLGGSNIGDVKMFAGATAPTNWLLCDGTIYLNTAIPLLAPVLANRYGGVAGTSNAVPPLNGRFPVGAPGVYALGATGGENTHTLAASEMPYHAHGVSDPTHAHSVYDPTHNHPFWDPGHTHGGYQDAHSHGIPDNLVKGSGTGLTNGGAAFSLNGSGRTDNQQPAVHIGAAGTNASNGPAGTGVAIYGAGTGIGIQGAGGSGAHENRPPFCAINFVIRYQ